MTVPVATVEATPAAVNEVSVTVEPDDETVALV
jgi:hypothetical protein